MFHPSEVEVRRKDHLRRLGTVYPVLAHPSHRYYRIKKGTLHGAEIWNTIAYIFLEVQSEGALVNVRAETHHGLLPSVDVTDCI